MRYKSGWDGWFAVQFGKIGMTFFEYVIGIVFSKEKLFTRIHRVDCQIRQKLGHTWYSAGWFLVFMALLIGRTIIVPNMIAAPFSGIVIIIGFVLINKPLWLERLFLFLGKHSTNIWLTHLFFYAVIFEDFIYIAKYPVLILFLMFGITISLSQVINYVMKPIQCILSKVE